MAEINLASSTLERMGRPRRAFDKYYIFIVVILFLAVAGFGGLRWYITVLDDRISGFDATLAEHLGQLSGEKVDRAGYFDQRLTLIGQQLKGRAVDPQNLLNQLQQLVVPGVRLTKYNYNNTDKSVEVAGEADNFKSVAQQIISLKSDNTFGVVKVELLTVTPEGRVAFSLKAELN